MSQSDRYSPVSGNGRNMALAGAVVVAHAAAVIALQHGLGKVSAPEVVVPATVIAEFVTAPAPEPSRPAPPPPPAPKPPAPAPTPVKTQPKQVVKKTQLPKAIKDSTPAPNAPQGSTDDSADKPDKTPPAPPAPPAPCPDHAPK